MTRTRRAFIAAGLASLAGLAGCVGGGNNPTQTDDGPEELITGNKETKVKTPDGITGRIRSVTHQPSDDRATISAEINVPSDGRYAVRLAVIDQRVVVLGEETREPELSGTGTNLETAELRVDDCEDCFSGLLEVSYTEDTQPSSGSGSGSDSNSEQDSDQPKLSGGNESGGTNESGDEPAPTPDEPEETEGETENESEDEA